MLCRFRLGTQPGWLHEPVRPQRPIAATGATTSGLKAAGNGAALRALLGPPSASMADLGSTEGIKKAGPADQVGDRSQGSNMPKMKPGTLSVEMLSKNRLQLALPFQRPAVGKSN